MADYYTLLTDAGIAYETACKAAGTPIKLSQISVGDGGGEVYNPAATATALKREVWRGPLNALFQDEKNPSWLLAEVTIPPDVGGWYVREAGIWTDTGILYAIVKYPESFKPVLATSGSGKEFYIRSIFETSNAELVTLLIDDTVVKATRAWVMSYLAEELAKLDGKQSVRVAATGNVVLSGAQQIDGIAVTAGQRVLLPLQTAARENGIWIAANGAWSRAADANTSTKMAPGLTVMVEEGAKNGDSLWHLVTNGPITLGTTALTFEMLAGRTGIAPGAYKSLTVDKYGRAVAGENPETLAGFGIKDTYTKPEIESMIAQASALPVGATVAFPLDKVAPGFLELDGSVKSIAVYPDLAAFLGTAFNKGNEGAGNFRLPESRGEFLRGWDHGRDVDAGRLVGSYQAGTKIQGDNDSAPTVQGIANIAQIDADPATGFIGDISHTATGMVSGSYGSAYWRTVRPRNLAVMWCIKAWNAPFNQGNIDIQALAALAMQATEANQGTAKVAAQALTDAGVDDTTIVTPKKLRWGFQILKAANGYVVFPTWLGGFIIQWGYSTITSVSTVIPFPLSYPNACFGLQATPFHVSGAADVIELTSQVTKSGFSAVGVSSGVTGTPMQQATNFYWLSIGH
ncbi:phage tail-collar fiber domain-containing protein [Pseudomonas brassicacearum]|jgi:phage-related tail fiber protein|uniref:phage tail-collar fiber domain-containing protein n=1 Tax=Pseudomonas brassicacearum TaxID=930166 RepID=UPI0006406F80|nr:phage tail protein [Pseudomonas brassicacearum]